MKDKHKGQAKLHVLEINISPNSIVSVRNTPKLSIVKAILSLFFGLIFYALTLITDFYELCYIDT